MSVNTDDTDDRLPTTGPEPGDYSRYQYVATDAGSVIHDIEDDDAWIQTTQAVPLKACR